MAVGIYHIEAEQGASFLRQLIWRDASGTVVDMTGFSARMEVRSSVAAGAPLLSLSTDNGGIVLGGVTGTITLQVSAAAMAALPVASTAAAPNPPKAVYVYDLELVSGDVVTRLVQGQFTVLAEVTR